MQLKEERIILSSPDLAFLQDQKLCDIAKGAWSESLNQRITVLARNRKPESIRRALKVFRYLFNKGKPGTGALPREFKPIRRRDIKRDLVFREQYPVGRLTGERRKVVTEENKRLKREKISQDNVLSRTLEDLNAAGLIEKIEVISNPYNRQNKEKPDVFYRVSPAALLPLHDYTGKEKKLAERLEALFQSHAIMNERYKTAKKMLVELGITDPDREITARIEEHHKKIENFCAIAGKYTQ